VLLILFILLAGCGEAKKVPVEQPHETVVWDSTGERGTFTDSRDGKTYKTIEIGVQVWMAENLDYVAGSSRCYDNKLSNCGKYRRLYNWAAAMKACPNGWHLPSDAEWDKLIRYVDGDKGTESPYAYESKTAGKYLKAKSGWNDYEGKSGNGEDTYGFSALPGGGGHYYGYFLNVGNSGSWWSSSEYNSSNAYRRSMDYYYEYVLWGIGDKGYLHSVRCVGD
jgi:uncharacterized protein (TIGR02145 family)